MKSRFTVAKSFLVIFRQAVFKVWELLAKEGLLVRMHLLTVIQAEAVLSDGYTAKTFALFLIEVDEGCSRELLGELLHTGLMEW